ncbi:MAG: protein kinase domain-containing protein [Acidimicrobiales bacterium]
MVPAKAPRRTVRTRPCPSSKYDVTSISNPEPCSAGRSPRRHPRLGDRVDDASRDFLPVVAGCSLEELLGKGSLGATWRARGPDGGTVALKRLAITGAGTLREMEALVVTLTLVSHPNLVRVVGAVPDGAGLAVMSRLVEGPSLAALSAGRLPLDWVEVCKVAAGAAEGLVGLAAADLVHGDLKPENILVEAGYRGVLADAGLALLVAGASVWGAAALGTRGYVDPLLRAGMPAGIPSDLYALGALCNEALTGRPPVEVARSGGRWSGEDRARLPRALIDLVDALMSPVVTARPRSAGEVAERLRDCVERSGLGKNPPPAGPLARDTTNSGEKITIRDGEEPRSVTAPPLRRRAETTGRGEPPSESTRWTPSGSPSPDRPAGRRIARGAAAGAAMAGCIALAWGGALLARAAGHRPPGAAGHRLPGSAGHRPPAEEGVVRAAPAPAPARWAGGVLTLAVPAGGSSRRFRVGRPGDELFVGAWHCSHSETLALYRPSTGDVYYFAGWPPPGGALQPGAVQRTRPQARPVLVRSGGCYALVAVATGSSMPAVAREGAGRPASP